MLKALWIYMLITGGVMFVFAIASNSTEPTKIQSTKQVSVKQPTPAPSANVNVARELNKLADEQAKKMLIILSLEWIMRKNWKIQSLMVE